MKTETTSSLTQIYTIVLLLLCNIQAIKKKPIRKNLVNSIKMVILQISARISCPIYPKMYCTKKAPNFFEAFAFWVDDRVRTGDPRYHKPML